MSTPYHLKTVAAIARRPRNAITPPTSVAREGGTFRFCFRQLALYWMFYTVAASSANKPVPIMIMANVRAVMTWCTWGRPVVPSSS